MIKHLVLLKIKKNDEYQRGLASMLFRFFDKRSVSGSGIENTSNKKLAEELHKPVIRKFETRKVDLHSSFKDNIWGADFANMQLISKFKNSFFIMCY